ncbi:MAG: hypothetical protein IJS60_04820, partial [Abditibacteriota bacterium]|nr:hypothetical protein [Abditibacteriota bacterium]
VFGVLRSKTVKNGGGCGASQNKDFATIRRKMICAANLFKKRITFVSKTYILPFFPMILFGQIQNLEI